MNVYIRNEKEPTSKLYFGKYPFKIEIKYPDNSGRLYPYIYNAVESLIKDSEFKMVSSWYNGAFFVYFTEESHIDLITKYDFGQVAKINWIDFYITKPESDRHLKFLLENPDVEIIPFAGYTQRITHSGIIKSDLTKLVTWSQAQEGIFVHASKTVFCSDETTLNICLLALPSKVKKIQKVIGRTEI